MFYTRKMGLERERGRENGSFPVAESTNRWVRERSPERSRGASSEMSHHPPRIKQPMHKIKTEPSFVGSVAQDSSVVCQLCSTEAFCADTSCLDTTRSSILKVTWSGCCHKPCLNLFSCVFLLMPER